MAGSRLKQYAYLNAKLKTRISTVIPESRFDRMIRASSVHEALADLEGTDFGHLQTVYGKTGDIKMVELELFSREIDVLKDLDRNVSTEIKDILKALSLRYEIDNLKEALRLWFHLNVRKHESATGAGYLYREEIVHPLDIDGIINARDLRELMEVLKTTPYHAVLAPYIPKTGNISTLFPLENSLDRWYYANLQSSILNLPEEDRIIAQRITGIEIDVENLSRIMRFTSYYAGTPGTAENMLIPGGNTFTMEAMTSILKKEDPWEEMEALVTGAFPAWKALLSSDMEHMRSRLALLESILQEIMEKEVRRLLSGNPFTVGILLSYVFIKRRELKKLMTLLNLKEYNIPYERGMKVL